MRKAEMNKREFVETKLKDLIISANDFFYDLRYEQYGYDEYVVVKPKSGSWIKVDVTDSSYLSIVFDVVKAIKNIY